MLLLAAVLVSSVIDQLVPKVSSPLIQIGLGLVIALFAPSQIRIGLDPDLFLVLFIAPLLYDEAKSVDKAALWRNRRPVLSLAIGLVVVTALVLGFAAVSYTHLGKSEEKITEELVGVIFKNPLTDQWESGDEYLSGNVRDKLNINSSMITSFTSPRPSSIASL